MSERRLHVRALLLDLDGTVADTHDLIFRCFSETLGANFGHAERSREAWQRCVGLPLEQIFAAVVAEMGRQEPSPEQLARWYRERLREIDHTVAAFPEVPEVLHRLKEGGMRLAIVTMKHEPAASRHLGFLKLGHLFDAVITGDQCTRGKPDPEPFVRALDALGVAPSEAAGVGDSQYDVRGARAAGLLAVAACWGTVDRDSLLAARADRVLEQPRELLGFLG